MKSLTKKKNDSNHKKNKSKKNYKKVNCSPNPDKQNFTCYSDKSLFKMKKYWNARHNRDKITTNDPKAIWIELKEKMSNSCDRESCWLRSKFMEGNVDSELLNYTFAPKSNNIWKSNEWLSSLDIESVMKQYEKYYKCFEFLGPSPIDFDHHKLYGECVWEELCKLNLSDMIKRHKNKIGIVLNTDPHYKEGSHWVAMFINIRKKAIYYFDSYGDKIPRRLMKFVSTVRKQARNLGEKYTFEQTSRRHQYLTTECGMYSLYFIIKLLEGKSIDFFKKRVTDKYMRKLRSIYFNKR